ncbi:hypothetical protein HWV62_11003 [Athelia sp. TMB]|nr:hypothetical protein HWV62_11003 [Athelia sp. TMB]
MPPTSSKPRMARATTVNPPPPAVLPVAVQTTPQTRSESIAGVDSSEALPAAEFKTGKGNKKHACWMCHKSFDRPRHVKRCAIMNMYNVAPSEPTRDHPTPPAPAPSSTLDHVSPAAIPAAAPTRAPKRKGPITPPTTPFGNSNSHPSGKRHRRAPSPSQWVPPSLQGFIICPPQSPSAAVTLPLPPVFPCAEGQEWDWSEERDSWATGVSDTPYHPNSGWSGTLPGPALHALKRVKEDLKISDGGSPLNISHFVEKAIMTANPAPCIAAAYYQGYDDGTPSPSQIDYSKFDVIFFAFATPDASSQVSLDSGSQSKLKDLVSCASQHKTKVVLSVGGWGGCKHYSSTMSSQGNRNTFVDSLSSTVNQYHLDGVDIDWEYPNNSGAGQPYSSKDSANFLLFLKALRSKLGSDKIISAAVTQSPWLGPDGQPLKDVSEFTKEMTYVNIIRALTGPTQLPMDTLEDLVTGWDEGSDTPFLYDTSRSTVVTYDDSQSLAAKAAYAKSVGMGGCFTWSLDQDDGTTLQSVIRTSLGI